MHGVAWLVMLSTVGASTVAALARDDQPALPAAAVAAFARGDGDELAALGRAIDAGAVRRSLTGGPGPAREAAIAVAPTVPDAWRVLPALATIGGGWDRAAAAGAATSARTIARALTADAVEQGDLGDDELAAAEQTWLALAGRVDRWPDLRATAIVVARAVAEARNDPEAWAATSELAVTCAAMRGDDEPAVRRAAVEATPVPAPTDLVVPLVRVLLEDRADDVALAAGQALCAAVAPTPTTPAPPVLGSIGPAGLERLRGLVAGTDDGLAIAAQLDAARCLAASGTREDEAAVHALAKAAPRSIREAIERWHAPPP